MSLNEAVLSDALPNPVRVNAPNVPLKLRELSDDPTATVVIAPPSCCRARIVVALPGDGKHKRTTDVRAISVKAFEKNFIYTLLCFAGLELKLVQTDPSDNLKSRSDKAKNTVPVTESTPRECRCFA
jgi:hypothetical protein